MSTQMDEKGRELTSRLESFAKDFQDNEAVTEDEKETAWKTLEGEFAEWSAKRARSESASDMMAKLANCGDVKDAETGESVVKYECASPLSKAGIKRLAAEFVANEDVQKVFGFKDGFKKKIDAEFMVGLKDASEALNLMGEGLDGHNSVSASAVGQNPFLGGTFGPGILPDWRPGIVEQLFYQLTINDLISSFATTAPNISYLTEASDNLQANQTAEGATYNFSSIELAREYAQIGKLTNALTITDEAVADAPTLFNFVQGRLLMALQRQEEVQVLAASGYPGVSGLLSFAGNFTASASGSVYGATSHTGSSVAFPPAGTNGAGAVSQTISSLAYGRQVAGSTFDPLTVSLNLKDAAVDIELAVFQSPNAHIMHPRDWQRLETAQDANLQFMNTSMFGNVYGVSRGPVKSLWGVPVVTTPLMPAGTILTGWFDPQTVQIARRQGVQMQMTNANESDFISGKITVRADERLGLLCYRPSAFELTYVAAG